MERTAKQHAVLIVDDEPSVLKALNRLLRDEDYRVYTAGNYDEAMTHLTQTQFAVVISDYRMPDVSGDDLLAIVQSRFPQTMRVMLSGTALSRSVPQTIAAGVLHCQIFLSKPWNDDDLRRTVRECIAQFETANGAVSNS